MSEQPQVTLEHLPESEVKINIVVPAAMFETYITQAAEALSKTIKVDGFRKGKIPQDVVERQVGQEQLLYEGAEKAVRKTYVDAVLDHKLETIGEPKVQITKIARGNDLEFSATVGLMPEITLAPWEPSLKKINKAFAEKKVEASEEEVKRELDFLAKQRATIVTVNRPVAKDDQVQIDFVVLRDGVPIEGGTAKNHQLVIGEGRFIPGFEEQLIGLEAGDEKTFELTFPKDYHQPMLAGQKASFEVKVTLVQERKISELDDAFAAGVGTFKTIEELKNNIREGIVHEKKHKQEEDHKRQLIDALVEQSTITLPHILVEAEMVRMKEELEHDIAQIGLNLATYLEQLKTTQEKLKEQWRTTDAPQRVKAALILRHLAEQQKIEAESKEIEEKMNGFLQYYKTLGDAQKQLDMERLYESTKGSIRNEKVFQYLMKI